MIKISVIIPTFGKPVFLERAIKSVLNQTFDDIELIIVDDNNHGTSERFLTESIVKEFINEQDKRIIYIKHNKNQNGSVARNSGFSIAKGKYIALLDNDDEYFPERIEKCFNKMEQYSEDVAGVYTGCEYRKGGKTYNITKNVKAGNFLVKTLAGTFNFGTGSNFFFRKKVVDELNGFDKAFLRHQDYEFLVRVFERNYSLAAIPEVLVIKNNENINLPDVYKMIEIKNQYLNKFKPIINNLNDRDKRYIYHAQYISIAEHALRSGKQGLAKKYYLQAKKCGTLTIKEILRRIIFTSFNYFHG